MLACKVLGKSFLFAEEKKEREELYFEHSRGWFQSTGVSQSRGCMTWTCCTGLSPDTHTIAAIEAQGLSKANSFPPAAQSDRAASSGNSPFTNLGFSAPSVQLSQTNQWSPNSSIYPFGKWGDMEKAGRRRQKTPQKRSKKSHTHKPKGVEHILQKAETPTSIRTRCLSNKGSWQTQLSSLEKMFVLIKDREEKKKMVKRKRDIKRPGAMQKQEARAEAVCLPHLWKHKGTCQGNSNSEGQLGTSALIELKEKLLPFPRSPQTDQQGVRPSTGVLTVGYRCLQDAALAKHMFWWKSPHPKFVTWTIWGFLLNPGEINTQKTITLPATVHSNMMRVSYFLHIKEQIIKPDYYQLGLATNFHFVAIWRQEVGPSELSPEQTDTRHSCSESQTLPTGTSLYPSNRARPSLQLYEHAKDNGGCHGCASSFWLTTRSKMYCCSKTNTQIMAA